MHAKQYIFPLVIFLEIAELFWLKQMLNCLESNSQGYNLAKLSNVPFSVISMRKEEKKVALPVRKQLQPTSVAFKKLSA